MARERGKEAEARLLSEVAQSGEFGKLSAFAPERLATTTAFFQDLVVMPLLLRALFGEKPEALYTEIGPHVERSVAFFLAACRHDSADCSADPNANTQLARTGEQVFDFA
jgi:hypothetical protein